MEQYRHAWSNVDDVGMCGAMLVEMGREHAWSKDRWGWGTACMEQFMMYFLRPNGVGGEGGKGMLVNLIMAGMWAHTYSSLCLSFRSLLFQNRRSLVSQRRSLFIAERSYPAFGMLMAKCHCHRCSAW
jgi:hypothetical protein